MKRFLPILYLIAFPVFIYSTGISPDGKSDRYSDLLNPGQMYAGAGVLQNGSLTDTFVNPAVQAFQKRFAFDINYSGIVGHTSKHPDNGYPGHSLTFGAGLPSPIGYFTLTGGYMHSSWDDFALGDQGFINVAIGKKVYDELYIGLGLKSVIGTLDGTSPDYLVAADLGVVHRPGNVGAVSDFQWGLALQNLGWGTMTPFDPKQTHRELLAPDLFSLQAGVSFSAVKTDRFRLGFDSELFLPSMMNFEAGFGFVFEFERIFAFSLSSRLNALQLKDGDYSNLLPSFGFVVRYIPKASELSDLDNLTEVHVRGASGAMRGDSLWSYQAGATVFLGAEDTFAPSIQFDIRTEDAESRSFLNESDSVSDSGVVIGQSESAESSFFKREPAKIRLISARQKSGLPESGGGPNSENTQIFEPPSTVENPQPAYYVSPNFDGIQDSLIISLDVRDTGLIKSFAFIIENDRNEAVRIIRNKEQREENRGADFFRNLFLPYKGIHIPTEIIWDCTSDTGDVVSDGLYSFYLTATDENGNISVTPRTYFAVDTVYPEVNFEYQPDDLIFSPNQDGSKDYLTVRQTSSEEILWKTQIENSFIGVVDSRNYKGKLPERLVWGGKNQSGVPVPDGTYRYRVEAVDQAGNRTEKILDGIILNTEQTPIQLFSDATAISPKSETGNPFITLTPDLAVKDDIVEWRIGIVDEKGNTVKELTGTGVMEGFVFDGLDENGEPFPDGIYKAQLDVTYRNGNRPQSVTPQFRIDTQPPRAEVVISDPVFSPDQDGQKDRLKISQKGTTEEEWVGEIIDQNGQVVFTQKWYQKLPETFWFDGYDSNNRLLPDGQYSYKLSSTDSAGNHGESSPVALTVDTQKSEITLKTDYSAFSPNGDGIRETVGLIPGTDIPGRRASYNLTVIDEKNEVVRHYPQAEYLAPRYDFDGKGDDGILLPDGDYRFCLQAAFINGQTLTVYSRPVKLKTSFPHADIKYENLWFSPDGDGIRDTLTWEQSSTSEELWVGTLKDRSGTPVKIFKFSGEMSDFEWDGKNNQGNLLPDGVYSYTLESVDEAGNRFSTEVSGIHLDKSPTLISITASAAGLSPNGDGRLDSLVLKPSVSNKNGIRDWSIEITGEKGQKTFKGEGDRIPDTVVWDGKCDDGVLNEGDYHLKFRVSYWKGNCPEAVIDRLTVDVTPPVLHVGLSPLPFSPDNDNINDELLINISFDDVSDIAKWQFAIYDPKNNPFKKFDGRGKKVDIIRWDGRSYKGETVFSAEDYPYRFMAADEWGNSSEVDGVIPIDILVVKDGDRFKIQIANITFAPNSPSLSSGDPVLVKKNKEILKRLSHILKKYKTYQVRVEGHANAVLWYNAVQAENEEKNDLYPLSLARARTIVAELESLGIDSHRLTAVGKGGRNPVIDPKKDSELWKRENWKNRRVEFILEK